MAPVVGWPLTSAEDAVDPGMEDGRYDWAKLAHKSKVHDIRDTHGSSSHCATDDFTSLLNVSSSCSLCGIYVTLTFSDRFACLLAQAFLELLDSSLSCGCLELVDG